jgi:hypothetical protein
MQLVVQSLFSFWEDRPEHRYGGMAQSLFFPMKMAASMKNIVDSAKENFSSRSSCRWKQLGKFLLEANRTLEWMVGPTSSLRRLFAQQLWRWVIQRIALFRKGRVTFLSHFIKKQMESREQLQEETTVKVDHSPQKTHKRKTTNQSLWWRRKKYTSLSSTLLARHIDRIVTGS